MVRINHCYKYGNWWKCHKGEIILFSSHDTSPTHSSVLKTFNLNYGCDYLIQSWFCLSKGCILFHDILASWLCVCSQLNYLILGLNNNLDRKSMYPTNVLIIHEDLDITTYQKENQHDCSLHDKNYNELDCSR